MSCRSLPINQIIQGDAVEVLRGFPDACIDTVITSPPYWGLRTYGTAPQIWNGSTDCRHKWRTVLKLWHSDRGDSEHKEIFDRGTTALVALALNRRFIGIELNPDYAKMAR